MNQTDRVLISELTKLLRWFGNALTKRDNETNKEQIEAHENAMFNMWYDMKLILDVLNKENKRGNNETKKMEIRHKDKKKIR